MLMKRGDAAQQDGTVCELQVTLGNESQQMQNNQKKKENLHELCWGVGRCWGGLRQHGRGSGRQASE